MMTKFISVVEFVEVYAQTNKKEKTAQKQNVEARRFIRYYVVYSVRILAEVCAPPRIASQRHQW